MNRNDDLIAFILGDAPASDELRRALRTREGRRELAELRKVLHAVDGAYREVPSARPAAFYRALTTPIGRIFVAVTDRGLVRLDFRRRESEFADELRRRIGAEVEPSEAKTAPVAEQLGAYFAGKRRRFDLPVDLRLTTAFQRRVLLAATRVPPGDVVSYGEIARRIGQPGASRAVGQALGRNPVPIVIPCHRIVAGGGELGGYAGGPTIKRKLLALEAA